MTVRTYTYKTDAAAGNIPAYVHYATPKDGGDAKPRPAVIIFHAGGFVVGSTQMIPQNQINALMDMGFVVVTPEYRLCPQVSLFEGPMVDARECFEWTKKVLPHLLLENKDDASTSGDVGTVTIDPTKVTAMGHSAGATLALYLGTLPEPPVAILDFYSMKNISAPFWQQPLPAFSAIPTLPASFLEKIYEGPTVPFTSPPMFVNGKPDLSTPRAAWMISALRDGTQLRQVVKDDDYARVDPLNGFSEKFPPTMFIHGTKDVFSPLEFAVEAAHRLKTEFNVHGGTECVIVQDQPHVFDIAIPVESELFQGPVMKGLRFLENAVKA